MRKLGYILALVMLAGCHSKQVKIYQNAISGRTYYHVSFTLTPANSSFVVPPAYQNSMRPEKMSAFSADGMFEVFVRTSNFPIPAPSCEGGWIILRMPGTSEAENANRNIKMKKELWDRLHRMYSSKFGSEKVVIELNPYIRSVDASGSKLELEYCNVFFRHAYGAYVPYVGPLQNAKKFKTN